MKTKMKVKDGFTLVEVIFSIAFLSIISVVILRLLVASYDVENQTDLMDMATLHLSNAIEEVKNTEDFREEEKYEKNFYDTNWQSTTESEAQFVVTVFMSKDVNYERGLYNIKAWVINLEDNKTLIEVDTRHYYNKKG